jgi:hypothetical protein
MDGVVVIGGIQMMVQVYSTNLIAGAFLSDSHTMTEIGLHCKLMIGLVFQDRSHVRVKESPLSTCQEDSFLSRPAPAPQVNLNNML